MVPAPQERVPHRLILTLCTVGATLMQALDQTIANVALPYMQGSLSATYDEITWVLTSYITAAAIMTAPVGWLASRFGRKYLFITCLIGFTVLSIGIGGLQMMLDRGQDQDWFSATEIIAEAVIGGLGVYLFIVHMCT